MFSLRVVGLLQRRYRPHIDQTSHILRGLATSAGSTMERLPFVNSYLQQLPVDTDTSSTPRQVSGACYVHATPSPVLNPELVMCSPSALRMLSLSEQDVSSKEGLQYLSGNRKLPGAAPVAHAYCGHQYGLFAGQLGDGAAMTLGTLQAMGGSLLELQLKGTGPTPFSRAGLDGRKVLRSSIREILCSEAMHHLGVPTTRAATCVVTGTLVSRDVHHTGDVVQEKATVVSRLAPSFLRVGSLEVVLGKTPDTGLSGPSPGDKELLRAALNYTIDNFYPDITQNEQQKDRETSRYIKYFGTLVESSARLVALWQSLGFCHGVLNTDNISLLGLTIDYGPFAFMDTFDPDFICNASDYWGRYSYRSQPGAVRWGFARLADVLQIVVPEQLLTEQLDTFDQVYEQHYLCLMRKKLGLTTPDPGDPALISALLDTMQHTGADFTGTFRALSDHPTPDDALRHILEECLCSVDTLKHLYQIRPKAPPEKLLRSLTVLEAQGHLLPQYLTASHSATEQLNQRPIIQQVQSMTSNTKRASDNQMWTSWIDTYKSRLLKEPRKEGKERMEMMRTVNPRFVLKNHILKEAIDNAEKGDYAACRVLLTMSAKPYDPDPSNLFGPETNEWNLAKGLLSLHDSIGSREKPLHIT